MRIVHSIGTIGDAVSQANLSVHRLVLLVGPAGSGKTRLLRQFCSEVSCSLVNVNRGLSQKLLDVPRHRRHRQVDRAFEELIDTSDEHVVGLDNLELLFDPSLQVDPLRLLQLNSRNRTLVASWNGAVSESALTYATPDHPEYRSYHDSDATAIQLQPANTSH